MNSFVYSFSKFVGIDVSKDSLDVAAIGQAVVTIGNTQKEINPWIKSLTRAADTIVVMEATGGYESRLVKLLHQHGIALAVVNPRQVQDFAKGIGRDCKTDACDARVISPFAEVVRNRAQRLAKTA